MPKTEYRLHIHIPETIHDKSNAEIDIVTADPAKLLTLGALLRSFAKEHYADPEITFHFDGSLKQTPQKTR